MSKLQPKNIRKKLGRSELTVAKQNQKKQSMVCKYCDTMLVTGGAILNDLRNYGMTGLFERTDRTGQAYTVRSSGIVHQVLKCPKCGYSVSNNIQRNMKKGTEPCHSVAVIQAATGEELLKFFESSPVKGAELDLETRDKSTGRVATFDN